MKTIKARQQRIVKGSFYSPKIKSNLKYERVPIIQDGKVMGYALQVESKSKPKKSMTI